MISIDMEKQKKANSKDVAKLAGVSQARFLVRLHREVRYQKQTKQRY